MRSMESMEWEWYDQEVEIEHILMNSKEIMNE